MTPAAPTRSDADVIATEPATAPPTRAPADDQVPASDSAPTATARPASASDPARAEVAAIFDEIAPVHDRLATLLSLGLDRRWRAAVVAETRLTGGDSAIDVAAGTGRLAADLADRVGPFGRVVAVD